MAGILIEYANHLTNQGEIIWNYNKNSCIYCEI